MIREKILNKPLVLSLSKDTSAHMVRQAHHERGVKLLLLFLLITVHSPCCSAQKPSQQALLAIKNYDVSMHLNGRIKEDLFVYNRVNTLRNDFYDTNEFVRHKLDLDFSVEQGRKKDCDPVTQSFVRLSNYVYWQDNSHYLPMILDQSGQQNLTNSSSYRDVHVKTLMPLIFAEQAWFKINFDRISHLVQDRPTSLKIGFFPYTLGRGISLGLHDDLAVEALGWNGEGDFTRHPYMPPAILFTMQLAENLTADFYYSKWREANASLDQTTEPIRSNRLSGPNPERGKGKDRDVWALKADYKVEPCQHERWHLQPYWLYVNAPEQSIEMRADASAQLYTLGAMVNVAVNNVTFNIECAGQCGHQDVHAIDRNAIEDGEFTHIFLDSNISRIRAPAGNIAQKNAASGYAKTENQLAYIVNLPMNRGLDRQGEQILDTEGKSFKIDPSTGQKGAGTAVTAYNSNLFNNKRFRSGYKLDYNGFMALADISYQFTKHPFRLGAAAGYIAGDEYPYNQEASRSFNGFIPLRSRYKGQAVQGSLIFDRLIIPRPMNISYKELYAFNNLKNLSDLQYLGLGLTWYPFKKRSSMSVTNDCMFFWKVASILKWDKNGRHPDDSVEAKSTNQLYFDRDQIGFSGWESTQKAHRYLGTEIDTKVFYHFIDQCTFFTKFCLFFPGKLYKDLDGQPDIATRRIDALGKKHYDSLGNYCALGFICGLDYRF